MTATPRPKGRTAPPAEATPASAWRAGELVRLPGSGHVARLRKPSLRALLQSGRVPSKFADSVYRLANPGSVAKDRSPEEQRQQYDEEAAGFVYVASQCLVEPRLVIDGAPNYDKGEIGADDLSDIDYLWIFYTWTEGDAASADPFRVAGRAGDAGLAGEALQPAA
jgi:hypothetical protein